MTSESLYILYTYIFFADLKINVFNIRRTVYRIKILFKSNNVWILRNLYYCVLPRILVVEDYFLCYFFFTLILNAASLGVMCTNDNDLGLTVDAGAKPVLRFG